MSEGKTLAADPVHGRGCLRAWVLMVILFNAVVAAGAIYRAVLTDQWNDLNPDDPFDRSWKLWALALAHVQCVVFAFVLLSFSWSKWGLFGLLGASLVSLVVHLYVPRIRAVSPNVRMLLEIAIVAEIAILCWVVRVTFRNGQTSPLERKPECVVA
jgi:hypothetical protein